MKKLSLLMFAILILGCGNETTVVEEPVVEEPEPVVEEPPPVVEELPPLFKVQEPKPLSNLKPKLAAASVRDGQVDVDPEPLNRHGIAFKFLGNLRMYLAELQVTNAGALNWSPRDIVDRWDIGNQIHLTPMADSKLLKYDTDYTVKIYAQDLECNGAWRSIKFRTKPR